MRHLLVAGARPNFVKVAPVLRVLEGRGRSVELVHTGQHYDAAMSEVFFDDLGIRVPDHHLGVGSGSHAAQTARLMESFEPLVAEAVEADDVMVIVPGDVNSTLACSVVAAKAGAFVAHVEAGLRSRDWSMPEEINRVVTDRVSDVLLASSPDAVENLRAEGHRDDQIHLVGNTMIDSLLANVGRAQQRPVLGELGLSAGGYGVVTLHRPANVDEEEMLVGLMGALGRVASSVPLVFPAHPWAAERLRAANASSALRIVEPLGYLDFLAVESQAALVLTDSGGVQEETTVLGVPCLTLRDNTERPVTVSEGTNQLVGRDPEAIVAAAERVLADGVEPRRPELWDGRASERIADALESVDPATFGRPTQR